MYALENNQQWTTELKEAFKHNVTKASILYEEATSVLPEEYVKLEYIESTGTQYIDTGYIPNNNTKIDIKFMALDDVRNVIPMFGARTSSRKDTYSVFYKAGNLGRIDYGVYKVTSTFSFADNKIQTFVKDKEKNYLNDIYVRSDDPIEFACSYPMYINSINTAGTPFDDGFKSKLYYTKIYDNNKLVRNLVPCYRKSDNKVGMYDLSATSKNLLNRATCDENKLLTWASGTPYDESGSLSTDFMEVKIGDKFTSNYKYQKMFYDKDKNYLGALCTDGTLKINRADIANNTSKFTVPNISDIYYVRLGYRKSLNSNTDMTTVNIMFNEGETDLPYEPYQKRFYTNAGTGEFIPGNQIINEINESNNLVDLTLTDTTYVPDLGFVGAACSKKLELTLQNGDSSINLENKNIQLKIGAEYNGSTYYINYGNFIVSEPPQIDETNGKIKIVAYDYMIKFNQPYKDRVQYPCTLALLAEDVCNQAGVQLGSNDFANRNFLVENNQFEGMQLREVIQNIAKCAFSWARIKQDNKLYFDFNVDSQNTETLTINDYKTNGFKKANEYYGPINQVTYADSNIEGQELRVKDQDSIDQYGLNELVIYDNLFAYTPTTRNELIQQGRRLFGLTYMPVSQLDSIGFIFLDSNDIINIETLDNQTYTTRPFEHVIKYTGITSDNIKAEAPTKNEQAYKNTATTVFQNQQTRIIVDKANKKINALVEDNAEFENKLVQLEATVDGITSEVENAVDYKREASGITQIHLENSAFDGLIELEIKGNKTYVNNLYPGEDLYPGENLYPNMEVADFDL